MARSIKSSLSVFKWSLFTTTSWIAGLGLAFLDGQFAAGLYKLIKLCANPCIPYV